MFFLHTFSHFEFPYEFHGFHEFYEVLEFYEFSEFYDSHLESGGVARRGPL